jgi:hypothetical protein
MSLPDSNAVHVQVLMSGFWDEPKYHQRDRFNPRKADELAALALSCRGESARIGRKVLPLVREFYSLKWYVPIESADDLRKRIDKVLSVPRTYQLVRLLPVYGEPAGDRTATRDMRGGPEADARRSERASPPDPLTIFRGRVSPSFSPPRLLFSVSRRLAFRHR